MSWKNMQRDKYEQEYLQPFFLSKRFTARLHTLSLALAAAMSGLEDAFRHRYASLLVYRLLFMYFLQHAKLLAGDARYLQRWLEHGGFYRGFLRPLFGGGNFPELCSLPLGRLFCSHEIEDVCPAIEIADEPFIQLLALFDEYLSLGNRRTRAAQASMMAELLGEVCEQHEHSREMGAYYTPRVVTSYIVRNTLPLALVTRTHAHGSFPCPLEDLIWQTLVSEPLRYIYPATLQGYAEPLPPDIAAGLADVTWRANWQQCAPPAYAHPGETWREVLLRRARVDEILAWTSQAKAAPLERLITWNINMPALLLHTLRTCQQAEVLDACYQSLRQLSVLDPTCGTGAFLCAAIPLLQDLYTVCLARMEGWSADPGSEYELTPAQRRTFAAFLTEAGPPAERTGKILQWIIAHNLYGVDLNEEAVEVCRLRLYLKLLATSATDSPPAVPETFAAHLHVGNSLLGSLDARSSEQGQPAVAQAVARQSRYQCAVHWGQVFPGPLAQGGFDVVIGNPPYIEYERVRSLYQVDGYTTLETGNLYALTMERALHLLVPGGRFGMVVPSSATCTQGYRTLQDLLLAQQELHVASFSDQRGHLFSLSHPRLCIILYTRSACSVLASSQPGRIFTTPYIKLGKMTRSGLFEQMSYTEVTPLRRAGPIPRYGSPLEPMIADKLARQAGALGAYHQRAGAYPVYFTRKLSWYVQVTPFIPRILDAHDQPRLPSELKHMRFASQVYARMAFAALNSNLFYWLITTSSDGRNLNMREVLSLPLDLASVEPALQRALCQLADELEDDLLRHSCMKPMVFQKYGRLTIQCLYPARSRPLIDEIDRILAHHYAFEEQELDFLLHYDAQYRNAPRSR